MLQLVRFYFVVSFFFFFFFQRNEERKHATNEPEIGCRRGSLASIQMYSIEFDPRGRVSRLIHLLNAIVYRLWLQTRVNAFL